MIGRRRPPSSLLAGLVLRRVVVSVTGCSVAGYDGLLWAEDARGVMLASGAGVALESIDVRGGRVPLDGMEWVPMDRIESVQFPDGGGG